MFSPHFAEDKIAAPGDLCQCFQTYSELRCPAWRITESLRLDETSRVIKANLQLNPPVPTMSHWETPHALIFPTFPGVVIPALPWSDSTTPSGMEFSLGIFPFPVVLSLVPWDKRLTHLAAPLARDKGRASSGGLRAASQRDCSPGK